MTEVLEAIAGIGPVPLALIWVATVAAAILRSFTGFGFALAAVPSASNGCPVTTASGA